MIWVAHIVFGACIATITLYGARTDDGRSAGYAVTDMMKEDPEAVHELLKRRTQKLN